MVIKINPKDVQAGDRVTLTGTVHKTYSGGAVSLRLDGDEASFGISEEAMASAIIERTDRDLLKAREIVAEMNDGSHLSEWVARVMEGRCDGHSEMKIALAALKAGRGQ